MLLFIFPYQHGQTALMAAAAENSDNILTILLAHPNIDVNLRDEVILQVKVFLLPFFSHLCGLFSLFLMLGGKVGFSGCVQEQLP